MLFVTLATAIRIVPEGEIVSEILQSGFLHIDHHELLPANGRLRGRVFVWDEGWQDAFRVRGG